MGGESVCRLKLEGDQKAQEEFWESCRRPDGHACEDDRNDTNEFSFHSYLPITDISNAYPTWGCGRDAYEVTEIQWADNGSTSERRFCVRGGSPTNWVIAVSRAFPGLTFRLCNYDNIGDFWTWWVRDGSYHVPDGVEPDHGPMLTALNVFPEAFEELEPDAIADKMPDEYLKQYFERDVLEEMGYDVEYLFNSSGPA
jgi:hypothetical protein